MSAGMPQPPMPPQGQQGGQGQPGGDQGIPPEVIEGFMRMPLPALMMTAQVVNEIAQQRMQAEGGGGQPGMPPQGDMGMGGPMPSTPFLNR